MLAAVCALMEEEAELWVIRIDALQAQKQVARFLLASDFALDEGKVQAGCGLAWVRLGKAVKKAECLREAIGRGVKNAQISERGGLIGQLS
jgi:hypothetical protein